MKIINPGWDSHDHDYVISNGDTFVGSGTLRPHEVTVFDLASGDDYSVSSLGAVLSDVSDAGGVNLTSGGPVSTSPKPGQYPNTYYRNISKEASTQQNWERKMRSIC